MKLYFSYENEKLYQNTLDLFNMFIFHIVPISVDNII